MSVYNRGTRFLAKRLPIYTFADDYDGHIDGHPGTSARGSGLRGHLSAGGGLNGGRKAGFTFTHEGSRQAPLYTIILRRSPGQSPEQCRVFHRILYER